MYLILVITNVIWAGTFDGNRNGMFMRVYTSGSHFIYIQALMKEKIYRIVLCRVNFGESKSFYRYLLLHIPSRFLHCGCCWWQKALYEVNCINQMNAYSFESTILCKCQRCLEKNTWNLEVVQIEILIKISFSVIIL